MRYLLGAMAVEDFKRLYDSTGWKQEEINVESCERAIAGSWLIATAESDGATVGMCRVISDGVLHAFITEMIVEPEWRAQGVGAELLEFTIAAIRERDIKDIQLFAAEGRADFYLRNGFAVRPPTAPGMQWAG